MAASFLAIASTIWEGATAWSQRFDGMDARKKGD